MLQWCRNRHASVASAGRSHSGFANYLMTRQSESLPSGGLAEEATMSRHHLRVVWAIAVAIAATPCRADGPAPYPEAPVAAPLPAPVLLVYEWSGLYVGGQ